MRFCGGCGRPLVSADPDEGAQHRHLTVMFCDMVGSTALAERLGDEDFREVLAEYQRACARAVERYDGWIAQWAGDGLLAYFGYPRAHEDDAHRAVHAGLAIVDEVARLSVPVQVRLGMYSGFVIAGETGTGDAVLHRGIVGTTPHIAKRLEAIAEPGTILIGDATRELVDGDFELRPVGERRLRGVAQPIQLYRVLRFAGGRLDRRQRPMVGRDAELARLEQAWMRAAAGRGAIVNLPGEAGIGKSRLVAALTDVAGGAQVWQCSAHHRSSSLYPVVRYLERTLGGAPLAEAVRTAGLDPREAVPLLADLLAVGDERSGLSPIDARAATLRVLESLLVADPARHPLLLVVEDLHWADPTTVELIERIATRLPQLPVLCVATYRREFEPPWPAELTLQLGRLSDQDVRAMVAARGVDADLSAAGGVPLFVEELLKAGESVVPPTLLGLLTQRLERLPELGEVVDIAAVLGRDFDLELLAALTPLGGALARLAEQDVIRPVDGAPSRLEFSHALLQEAAYTRLLRRRRHALHARVATALTERFADVVEREPELVANHWTRAGEPEKAVPHWYAAGERALGRAAFLEAADHFRHGLQAGAADRGKFLIRLAASLQAGIGYAAPGVDEAYAEARRSAAAAQVPTILRGQWSFHLLRAEYDKALAFADEMLALGLPGDGHLRRGMVQMYRGDFRAARDDLTVAADLADPPQPSGPGGDAGVAALAYLAVVLWNLGEADEALARSERSLELAEHVGPVARAQAWGMRSLLHLARGELAPFADWVERTRAFSAEHNVGYWRALSSLLGGWLEHDAGLLDASLDAYQRSGARLGLSRFYILQADVRLRAGDRAGALAAVRAAERHVAETGERYAESELYRFKGQVLMDPHALQRAVAVAREQGAVMLERRAAGATR
jgi:class 3 adenylate cyclase